MKLIFKVAKTELRSLFYSPIAWLLLVAFLVQCAVNYIDSIRSQASMQQQGGEMLQYLKYLTHTIFSNTIYTSSVFVNVVKNIYLYIPLLTMGLLSREQSSGTIKLLYSSPVKIRQIVYGKFLTMVIFSLLMVLIVAIFAISGAFHIQHADIGILWTGLTGIFLLLCTYSAIGLFMSSLTSYQVVAAICTFAMFGLLNYMGNVWQRYDFLRDVAYFLSMQGRTQNLLNGLVASNDVLYFLVIIFMFIAFTILRLGGERKSQSVYVKTGKYLAVIFLGVGIGYFCSKPALLLYYDATATQSMTATKNVQKVLKGLGDEPLKITKYNNVLGSYAFYGYPSEYKRIISNWDIYLRFKPEMEFSFVNYYDYPLDAYVPFEKQYPKSTMKQVAGQVALSFDVPPSSFKTPEQIQKMINLQPELNRFVMELEWKGKKTFLRVFNDALQWPDEAEVAAAVKRLQIPQNPKVGFVIGNLERDINKSGGREYSMIASDKTVRVALVNQGFDLETINLDSADIDPDITTLVIADPKSAFSEVAAARLRTYINQGRNLLITGEPGKQSILNPLLEQLGIEMINGAIVQPTKKYSADQVLPSVSDFARGFSSNFTKDVTNRRLPVALMGASGLRVKSSGDFSVQPLLTTDSSKSWLTQQPLRLDSADFVYNAANGDEKVSLPVALALTRNIASRQQRVVVVGDADFMSSENISRRDLETANFNFASALFSWLSYGEFPIEILRADAQDIRMNVSLDTIKTLNIIYVWVLPAVLIIGGTFLLIRRKRK